MKNFLFLLCVISFALVTTGCLTTKELTPEETATVKKTNSKLPFGVKIDENSAKTHTTIAALIEVPVSADAEIICDIPNNDIINITFFPCDHNGIVVSGKRPELIIIREGSSSTLDKTIDGKKLCSGFYLMDVSNETQTSRIIIKIK